MSNRPYSTRRARLMPDLSDSDLYGAWTMVPQGGVLADHTVQGNDGTIGNASTVENTILGPMRRYEPNSGSGSTAIGLAGAFALNDLTVSLWLRNDPGAVGADWAMNYRTSDNDQWGIRVTATDISIWDDIDNANQLRYTTLVPHGQLFHVVGVMDSLENLLYINGVLAGSGGSSSDDWASYNGLLYHGGLAGTSNLAWGIVGPMEIYSAAKDQTWVTRSYEKGARACQFKTDWGVRQSTGNETAGHVGANSSPFEIVSGTWQMSMDTIDGVDVKVIECIAAGIVVCPTSYFEATPTECAFGSWRWWGYLDDGNSMSIAFISTDQTVAANGYNLTWDAATTAVDIIEAGVGNIVAGGLAAAQTWQQFDVTRSYVGQFEGFVNRTTFGTGTDLTITTSDYVVLDMDAGDKIAHADRRGDHSFAKYLGVLTP